MNDSEIALRYWWALRHATENFVKETDKHYDEQNGTLIHCLHRVVNLRISELDRVEGKR